jgi:hypothetical protein
MVYFFVAFSKQSGHIDATTGSHKRAIPSLKLHVNTTEGLMVDLHVDCHNFHQCLYRTSAVKLTESCRNTGDQQPYGILCDP